MNEQTQQSPYVIAVAIVVGFGLVAAAIFFGSTTVHQKAVAIADNSAPAAIDGPDARRGADEQRNLYGNPDAKVTIVEFSDFECPFCARLHPTLEQIVDNSEGEISWEYRHLPLPGHQGAEIAAIASECVAQEIGNDAFWEYTRKLLDNQRSITAAFLEEEAIALGLASDAYAACITSEEVAARVQADADAARSLGGRGTPYSVVRFPDGTQRPVSGALPYADWIRVLAAG